jgi:hypothetical protein
MSCDCSPNHDRCTRSPCPCCGRPRRRPTTADFLLAVGDLALGSPPARAQEPHRHMHAVPSGKPPREPYEGRSPEESARRIAAAAAKRARKAARR